MERIKVTGESPESALEAAPKAKDNGMMIRVRGVAKAFGRKMVHRNINLDIPAWQTVVVIGGSGEGKSVLLKEMSGLLPPDRGSIMVDGDEIVGRKEKQLLPVRRKIGMVFQGAALFDSMTVRENVGFAMDQAGELKPGEIDEIVREKLRLVKLEDAYDKMPAELSGGMKKRVGVARAIATNAKIIFWDEPTTGLDPITANSINELINEIREQIKVTSVVITHDMGSAFKVADRIAMLYQGEIIWDDTVENTRHTDNPIVRQFIQGDPHGPITGEGKK